MTGVDDGPPPGFTRHEVQVPVRFAVAVAAGQILGEDYVRPFMTTPHPDLDGVAPEALLPDAGVPQADLERVSVLLIGIRDGGPAAAADERARLDAAR